MEIFKSTTTGASADGTYVPDAPFVLLGHNTPADVPVQQYPTGGLFSTTPINSNPIAQYMFMPFSALAAGLAISPDGSTLYVANYQNDSLSIINTSTRTVSKEVVFFAPGQTTAIGEMPYWPVVLSDSKGAPVKTYVSSQRDGQVLSVSPSGSFKVIKVGGEPNRMALSADQLRLYVANGDLDEIEVIDTTKDALNSRISVARPGYHYKGSSPNSVALSPGWPQSLCHAWRRECRGCYRCRFAATARSYPNRLVSKLGDGQRRREKIIRGEHEIQCRPESGVPVGLPRGGHTAGVLEAFCVRHRIRRRAMNTSWPC